MTPPNRRPALRTRVLLVALAALVVSCKDDVGPPAPSGRVHTSANTPDVDQVGQERGEAMLEEAAKCDPTDGQRDVGACERACTLGHSNSCAHHAQHVLSQGERTRATEAFSAACRGGSGVGCEGLARLTGLQADYDRARFYHRVHCEQGYARSCLDLAGLFEAGLGGAPDAATAAHYRALACSLDPACKSSGGADASRGPR